MKQFDKIKESSHVQYLDAYNLHGWTMFEKLPVNGFRWKKMCLNLMKSSQKIMIKIVTKNIFLK